MRLPSTAISATRSCKKTLDEHVPSHSCSQRHTHTVPSLPLLWSPCLQHALRPRRPPAPPRLPLSLPLQVPGSQPRRRSLPSPPQHLLEYLVRTQPKQPLQRLAVLPHLVQFDLQQLPRNRCPDFRRHQKLLSLKVRSLESTLRFPVVGRTAPAPPGPPAAPPPAPCPGSP